MLMIGLWLVIYIAWVTIVNILQLRVMNVAVDILQQCQKVIKHEMKLGINFIGIKKIKNNLSYFFSSSISS